MELIIILLILYCLYALPSLFRSMEFNKNKDANNQYKTELVAAREKFFVEEGKVSFPVIDPNDYSYRPVAKESLLAVHDDINRLEMKSTGRYTTSGMSVSVPLTKGVRFRLGNGSIRTQKALQITASGRLLITDKAIIYESSEKNERIPWGQISDIELLFDGYKIFKRSGLPKMFSFSKTNANFAAIMDFMLRRVG